MLSSSKELVGKSHLLICIINKHFLGKFKKGLKQNIGVESSATAAEELKPTQEDDNAPMK